MLRNPPGREPGIMRSFESLVTPAPCTVPLHPQTGLPPPPPLQPEDLAQPRLGFPPATKCRVTADKVWCDHGQNGPFHSEHSGLLWPRILSFWGKKRHGKEREPGRHLETTHSEGRAYVTAVKWLSGQPVPECVAGPPELTHQVSEIPRAACARRALLDSTTGPGMPR